MSKSSVTLRFWRDASERLTFDVFSVEASHYPALCRSIADEFALMPVDEFVFGLDLMFWVHHRGSQVVCLAWDNWMSFMVSAETEDAEPLVQDIAGWLSSAGLIQGDAEPSR